MKGSKERIDFIIEYISAYEQKIKLANKNGLFDEALLFELFAQQICKLWFDQDFINLNMIKKNYPFVDLRSADGAIFVQVSTQATIFDKIKTTLRELEKTDIQELANITTPVFFVLSNESELKVKDLIDEKQIGKYPFTVEKNIISTAKIVQRAKNDINFQIALYKLLKEDVEGVESLAEKILFIFDNSRTVGLFNIDTAINGEYEIDRSSLTNQIRNDNNQFILITGEAGSGKSSICKKILINENVFFVRADKLANCHSIDNIWDISITKAFRFLQGKRVIIYIDALEYIASANESVKMLVQSLLNEINRYPNLSFIASCRTCDKNAFIKLIGLFNIKEYTVEPISNNELREICRHYPVIKEATSYKKYTELLSSPFYINEIVSKSVDLSELSDINEFRAFIWKECICLNKIASEKAIPTNEVVRTIKSLALERSKNFVTGIPEDELDAKILDLLRSNNVVTNKDSLVRFKYDIYEDICFEKLFDDEFDACKGMYSSFFLNIENMGYGAYRRYQIWISNKLLAKDNRYKFLNTLLFSNGITSEWHRNTIIGLVKSPFCKDYFIEQEKKLIAENRVQELIDIVNCFSFEMWMVYYNEIKSICQLRLRAVGYGRIALINLVFENGLYKNGYLEKDKIIKLCNDYAIRSSHFDEADEHACVIISYYIDEYLNNCKSDHFSQEISILAPMLEVLYTLPVKAHKWLNDFWCRLITTYTEGDDRKARTAEELLKWTIEHPTKALVDEEIEKLLEIATVLWTRENIRDKQRYDLYGNSINNDYLWGIRGSGQHYTYDYGSVESCIFFRLAFLRQFKISLNWAIKIINEFVSKYSLQKPNDIKDVIIFNGSQNKEKTYIGSAEMWLAGRVESAVPALIGDLIYWLKKSAFQMLRASENDKSLFIHLAQYIKHQILEESKNIIPLTIIEDIGFEFGDIIPGYAICLASSIDIIFWDIQWIVHNMSSPAKSILTEQIKMSIGIPDLKERYPRSKYNYQGLQDYIVCCQLSNNNETMKQCAMTLDYLYNKIEPENSMILLQVQKMDMRKAKLTKHGNDLLIEPSLSYGPQKIVDDNESKNELENNIFNKLNIIIESNESDQLNTVLEELETIKHLMSDKENAIKYEYLYIMFICAALREQGLSRKKRTELVCDWIKRLENIFSHEAGYVADLKLSAVLFQQYWNDIEIEGTNRLKSFMLLCLTVSSSDGQIDLLKRTLLYYLSQNEKTARILFNTIISIAEDEWVHSSYNQKLLHKNRHKKYSISYGYGIPNSDDIVREMGLKPYKSQRKNIIKRYLYDEEKKDINKLDYNKMDQGFLFKASNSGLRLANPDFGLFVKEIMPIFIKSMDGDSGKSVMNYYYERLEVKEMFKRELTDETADFRVVVDLLFDEDLLKGVGRETAKMYLSIFDIIASQYFDSYKDKAKRKRYCDCIEYTEKKINNIMDPSVKNQMEKILLLGTDVRFGDWNRCETHYSYDDKLFMCSLWERHLLNHENEVLKSIYQMKIGELLPEILPIVCKTVESIINRGGILDEDSKVILSTIVLKSLLDFSEKIKSDFEFHTSYEKLLNMLIDMGDEKAAVILDEYRTH